MSLIVINENNSSANHSIKSDTQSCTWEGRVWEMVKETAVASLPFLTLYKPLSFPISLGIGVLRVGVTSVQLADAIREGDSAKILSASIATTIAVICVAGTIFAHPLGMLIATGYDSDPLKSAL